MMLSYEPCHSVGISAVYLVMRWCVSRDRNVGIAAGGLFLRFAAAAVLFYQYIHTAKQSDARQQVDGGKVSSEEASNPPVSKCYVVFTNHRYRSSLPVDMFA